MNSRRKLTAVSSSLYCGTAVAALAMFYPLAASAQPAAPAAAPETVTVTGTIIRGAGPTGSNLITVDRSAIEASGATTIGQVLANVPGLNNFGASGQGPLNAADPGGASSPTIHSLGSSASNGTLILVDSHRLPPTGIQHNTIDPSAVPVIALQQVQVLPDGASATYGSDAVAGVLNFITRKNFTGMEFDAQYGMADHWESFSAGALIGHDWSGGSALLAYEYVSKSQFSNGHRDFQTSRQDIRLGTLANPTAVFPSIPATTTANTATVTNFLATTPDNTHGTTGPFSVAVPYPSLGSNFQNFACPVATIRNNGAAQSFLYPYNSNVGITNTGVNPQNGVCDETNYGTWLPSENRNTVFFSFKQELTDSISLTADFDYSTRYEGSINSRGTLSNITVFGPGNLCTPVAPATTCGNETLVTGNTVRTNGLAVGASAFAPGQVNPFYTVGSTGLSTTATQISYDPTALLAGNPPSLEKTGDTIAFANLGLDWDLGGDWVYSIGGTFGIDYDIDRQTNQFCQACAELALNGTTNNTGKVNNSPSTSAIADPAALGTVLSETRALTTLNALDVWNPAGPSNRTSAAVIKQLTSGFSNTTATQVMQDASTQIGGPLFDLPAGPVKVAIGAEYSHYTDMQLQNNQSNAEGPAAVASQTVNLFYARTVWAAYAEILIPLISPEMNIPLVQKFTMDTSGRVDTYTNFGTTQNPKVGFTWQVVDGMGLRGSYGTSFTVPAFASGGTSHTGITSQSAVNSGGTPNLAIPFNDTTYNGGAGVAGTWLATPVGCFTTGANGTPTGGGSTVVDVNGNTVAPTIVGGLPTFGANAFACKISSTNDPDLQYAAGGKPNLLPETGLTYSFGADFDAGKFIPVLDGLTAGVTYFQAKYQNLVTSIGIQAAQPALTFFGPAPTAANPKGGWLPTDPFITSRLIYPLQTTLPANIYTFFDGRQTNAYTLWENGLDYEIHYVVDTDIGTWKAGINGTEVLRFTQRNVGQTNLINIKNGVALGAGRFAGQEMTWTAKLGWNMNPYSAQLGFNFQSPYFQAINNTFPYTLPGINSPAPGVGSAQKIGALFTMDLNLGYTIPEGWYKTLTGTQVNLSISNLLDTNPPFQDNANGFGPGNQIGRQVTVSLKKTF